MIGRRNLKKRFSSEFFKYTAVLLSANVLSQLIAIAIYPFITRMYTPEIFGEFTWFTSMAAILTIVATGRYESAIVLPKSEKKAIAAFQLSLFLNVLFGVLFLLIVLVWKGQIASLFKQEKLISLLPLLPFFVFLSGLWQILNYFFIRQKKYYNISTYNLTQSSINSALKCFFGIKGFIQSGLIWGTFIGRLIAIVSSLMMGKASLKKILKLDKAEIIDTAKTYSNFPKFVLPQGLLILFAGNLPVLLLSAYFEMGRIGLFSLAFITGFCPVNLFCESVYQVLFRKMSERFQNKERIQQDFFLFCKTCIIAILPVFIIFAFISEWVYGILFGSEWKEAGFYLTLMLPWLFMVVLTASLAFIPDLFSQQKTAMKIEIIHVILIVISLALGIYFQNFNLAIALYCSASTLIRIVKLFWYFRLIKTYDSSLSGLLYTKSEQSNV